VHRSSIVIVTPALTAANNGNWQTARRWARLLGRAYRITLTDRWEHGAHDCMIALHARRSAPSIHTFAAAHPQRPLIVVLTGTDLYRDIKTDAAAQRSLQLATRLVVLQDEGVRELPAALAQKTSVAYQSTPILAPAPRRRRSFDVVVLGHLRDEKDPRLAMDAARRLPADSPVRILHIGAALSLAGRTAAPARAPVAAARAAAAAPVQDGRRRAGGAGGGAKRRGSNRLRLPRQCRHAGA
jgi:hypothetical protein